MSWTRQITTELGRGPDAVASRQSQEERAGFNTFPRPFARQSAPAVQPPHPPSGSALYTDIPCHHAPDPLSWHHASSAMPARLPIRKAMQQSQEQGGVGAKSSSSSRGHLTENGLSL